MKTTIKYLREMIDTNLISVQETVGMKVKVGFLELTVKGYELTPGDYLPNIWHLERNGTLYEFTPYNGLQKV